MSRFENLVILPSKGQAVPVGFMAGKIYIPVSCISYPTSRIRRLLKNKSRTTQHQQEFRLY